MYISAYKFHMICRHLVFWFNTSSSSTGVVLHRNSNSYFEQHRNMTSVLIQFRFCLCRNINQGGMKIFKLYRNINHRGMTLSVIMYVEPLRYNEPGNTNCLFNTMGWIMLPYQWEFPYTDSHAYNKSNNTITRDSETDPYYICDYHYVREIFFHLVHHIQVFVN